MLTFLTLGRFIFSELCCDPFLIYVDFFGYFYMYLICFHFLLT